MEPGEWLNHRIKGEMGSFLVIKQVCVAHEAARQGVASDLYRRVLGQWSSSPVIAAVVTEPVNRPSTAFHRRMGFEVLTELTPPDGRPRRVWMWRRPREAMLQAKYAVAVCLYEHEDTTNWNKLRGSGGHGKTSKRARVEATIRRCGVTTPFGRPAEPDVNTT